MKRRLVLYPVLLAALLFIAGCGGKGGDDGGGASGGGGGGSPAPSACSPAPSASEAIAINGNFTGGTHVSLAQRIFAAIVRPAYALRVADMKRAVAITPDGSVNCANVTNGSFSLIARRGRPVAAVFVGDNDAFLGYLSLGNGIDSMPLGTVAAAATSIELQTLSSSGQTVQPGTNPIGQQLPLTAQEQLAVIQANSMFAAVVRNPDVDGNGRVDALERRFFNLPIWYHIIGGAFGNNLVPTVNTPARFQSFRLNLSVVDTNVPNSFPGSVSFTGPAGSALSNSASTSVTSALGDARFSRLYSAPDIFVPPVPPAGQYRVTYGNQTLTFNLPDQSTAPSSIVLPVPSVTLNADGTVHRLSWTYHLGSGGAALNPLAVIERLQFFIRGTRTCAVDYGDPSNAYDSNYLPAATTEHVLACQSILWSTVTQVAMSYFDLYGNLHGTSFDRP